MISIRFWLFVASALLLSGVTACGFYSLAVPLYFVTGTLWFLHLKTMPMDCRPYHIGIPTVLVWPVVAYFRAKSTIKLLNSPGRFSVEVRGPVGVDVGLAPLRGEFRRWKNALQYARAKSAETGGLATIVDTGRLEWRKYDPAMESPLYFVEPTGAVRRYRG